MVVIRPLHQTNPVQYLVLWKFPELAAFSSREARETSSWTDERWRELHEQVEAYRDQLEAMPEQELGTLLAEAKADERRRYDEFRENEERNRIYNSDEAKADFGHWASASYWTIDEAAALSLGKDPRIVTWKRVEPHVHISPFARSFADRRDLLQRAEAMGQLYTRSVPSIFLAWAERMRLSAPADLVEAVTSLGVQIADWKTLYEQQRENFEIVKQALETERAGRRADASRPTSPAQKELPLRERDSLLKLVIGMAVEQYGFDPKASRNNGAANIASDLQLHGLMLSDDTIRKYLREGADLLPPTEAE